MKYIFTFLLLLSIQQTSFSQKKNELQFLKIYEDNDFLNLRGEGTDRGYSSGLKLELYYTKKGKARFPSSLLINIKDSADNLYGWGISENIFTSNDIATKSIQYGDRPYAGTLVVSKILISSDNVKKQKLTTSISLGVIGEAAFGKQIQTWVHKAINYQVPNGWGNQIKNDVLINYYINYEKQIVNAADHFEVIGNVNGNLGTMYNNIGAGVQFRAGMLGNYFSNGEKPGNKKGISSGDSRRKIKAFFYMKAETVAVMNNSLLQGGFFTHNSSPYVIKKDDLNRVYLQYEYGFVVSKNRFGVAFSEKMRTEEFKGMYAQQVGNITFYVGL